MMTKLIRVLKVSVCAVLIAQFLGCGTIMYPERRGQRGGNIDAGVAIMDGIGLLIFLIPGVIAFAVDFSTGAIYLPGSSRGSLDKESLKVVKFDPKNCTYETLERIVKRETGIEVKLGQPGIKVTKLGSNDNIKINLAKAFGGR